MTQKNPWTYFWQKGAKASFLDERSRLQIYQMRKFWFERMDELSIKQPVVDIGTGNGIAVEWLNEYAEAKNKKLEILGIDSAQINPPNKQLKLTGETPYETFSLPSNKKVGTFVSHYGLEYGDMSTGLKNLHRQLKRGGALIALVHSKESTIYQQSQAIYDLLPSALKHLKKSVAPLQHLLLKQGPNNLPSSALQAQQLLNQFARKHERNRAFHAMNFVPATKHLLKAAAEGKETESHQVYNGYLESLTAHKARTQTLLKATEQIGSENNLKASLEGACFKKVSVQEVQFPESGEVGYCIQAFK
ncbi:MAG: class I SAM-dependent methyltransferase [Idiomarinaceae bacterium]|uniref:class I SAM-dependent methyltransferase n=1 Tax=Idiomarina sp. 28-8 TaxID=1260624 RepID=UPI000314BEDC|nr:class I SAM-dependent methyltransferase [Idiomarina sp. 28-8]NWO02231.1 class I SAM-dependent methyltransferase [Idiomarinaceae bacterium]